MRRWNVLSLIRPLKTKRPNYTKPTRARSPLYFHTGRNSFPHEYVYLRNRALDSLIKSGDVDSALKLFDEMPQRDVVTFNLLISGQGRRGMVGQAFSLYADMVSIGIQESALTFSSVLTVCTNGGFYGEAAQVHCRVICLGFSSNVYIVAALVGLYLSVGLEDTALRMMHELPERSLAMWNLVSRGFVELRNSDGLFRLFSAMKVDGFEPNALSFCYMINVCCKKKLLVEGKQLHCYVIKAGWESQIFVANSLVDFYSYCSCLDEARKSFDSILINDVISWNSLMSVCAGQGLLHDALDLFSRMRFWGKRPSVRSLVGLLTLASEMQNVHLGKQVHCLVLKLGFNHGSVYAQSALIDMYGKCSEIECSISVFDSLPEKCLACCNSMMTSLLYGGLIEDVVELFGLVVGEGIGFDEVTLSTSLKAISMSTSGSFASSGLIHGCAVKSGCESDIAVSCSLIDAYSRWGHTDLSLRIFKDIASPNVTCFTAMISAYARNGMGREGLRLFYVMNKRGIEPDEITFLSILTCCNHSGLVEEGRSLFYRMEVDHGIILNEKHYSCMIDLLGRAGILSEAEELLKRAPHKTARVAWSSLLRSCRVHGNGLVGRRVAKKLMELELDDPDVAMQVSNFYREIGEFETSMQIREIAVASNVTREFGHSLIEVKNCIQQQYWFSECSEV